MNHPLLYPFIGICIIVLAPLLVWGFFTLRARWRDKYEGLSPEERRWKQAADSIYANLTAPRPAITSTPMYEHRGHRHAARRRGKNRAAFRRYLFKLLAKVRVMEQQS